MSPHLLIIGGYPRETNIMVARLVDGPLHLHIQVIAAERKVCLLVQCLRDTHQQRSIILIVH